jgi:ectoine hydroxylase-related dioxygenase (phytanoyl-CoA dioxygenase family)
MTTAERMQAREDDFDEARSNYLVEQFQQDGYIIIEDILPQELVAEMYREYMKALDNKVRKFGLERVKPVDGRDKYNNEVGINFKPEGGNHDLNRWNMHVPSAMPFLDSRVVAHPQVVSVLEKILGQEICMYMLASDTPFPGSGFQSFHQDFHRMALTINIPLVDFTEENAPLEVIPGTHRKPDTDNKNWTYTEEDVLLSKEQLKHAIDMIPSKRLLPKVGSIVIRDQRLIHRGTAHNGDSPRPTLSLWVKSRKDIDILKLNTPIPHRFVTNLVAKLALKMRRIGKGTSSKIKNQELLNLGNLLGRLADEISGSDRDYRRVISQDIWQKMTPDAKYLLRYAEVEAPPDRSRVKRSIVGSLVLVAISAIALVWWLKISVTNIFK